MFEKLSEEKKTEILETGIAEFAQNGVDRANINVIAKKAGISVGVLYKYYTDKETFFLACLKRSLDVLTTVLQEQITSDDKLLVRTGKIIRAVQKTSREHTNYIRMYNEITSGGSRKYAPLLAEKIECLSSTVYTQFIAEAAEKGDIRDDIEPRMFAFFFDNLLMMLQFSYSCDYYRERFKVYCGETTVDNDELVASQLTKFLESAFTFRSSDVKHQEK
ncbi:MAG: TetR/AcrR family transcriptional regulator [Treponema sp.]|nr:TetR/AcrR family transcriptional regulator [Treponema sp.]